MIIYPSIDIRGGKVVRLREGDLARETVFYDQPADAAQRWLADGATWLHVVNLDGAFDRANDNERALAGLVSLGASIQFAGGLRTTDDVARALGAGVARVVLGTVAVQQPEVVEHALAAYGPERVAVALDARAGRVTTHGWTIDAAISPTELGRAMHARGVRHALYTDVARDGLLAGADLDGTLVLMRATGLHIIASGGVSTAQHIRTLAAGGAAGAVIGMALYTGQLALPDALRAAQQPHKA